MKGIPPDDADQALDEAEDDWDFRDPTTIPATKPGVDQRNRMPISGGIDPSRPTQDQKTDYGDPEGDAWYDSHYRGDVSGDEYGGLEGEPFRPDARPISGDPPPAPGQPGFDPATFTAWLRSPEVSNYSQLDVSAVSGDLGDITGRLRADSCTVADRLDAANRIEWFRAEVERLTRERNDYAEAYRQEHALVDELEAEVERLREFLRELRDTAAYVPTAWRHRAREVLGDA
jgi:hypothetical protein